MRIKADLGNLDKMSILVNLLVVIVYDFDQFAIENNLNQPNIVTQLL